ncbi:alpha/beta fold hydrolase [Actinokineospora spheciospongiae]|uniref:alpha/beta fold hydrolase n=1 Tax=Actinokineospora spheciospongiae TaxID=909613 RepID=UPI000D712574|nr:alpha/beta fold hydrolase [Actinokineospora spheciospongiae]PWW63174.1 pimeloyl-ACP methyl ester carboxylesterase [Actinokineospora spheciospongiae]
MAGRDEVPADPEVRAVPVITDEVADGVARCEDADDGVTECEAVLHGRTFSYLRAGTGGPTVVLLHGLAGDSETWRPVLPLLAEHATVIAPDLLGHGRSAKPRSGDYSVGSYAAGLRDLLVALDLDRATIIGHSFGGGVAMQFAYQFPEATERLVLVASGGLGHEVTPALRAATIPGSVLTLRLITALTPKWVGNLVHRVLRAVPPIAGNDLEEVARAVTSLADHGARSAFVHTARSALDIGGQRLDATEKLYLTEHIPLLLITGDADVCIPAQHSIDAHEQVENSRLSVFEGSGHFPHLDDPERFAGEVAAFLRETVAATDGREHLRAHLVEAG